MISPKIVLAFTLLLLPIPLSFLIPPSRPAEVDTWKIRRLRTAVILFAAFVGLIYSALIRYQWSLDASTHTSVSGVFLWSIMAWFFLGNLVFELRRSKPDPFPGITARSASLTPREDAQPVPKTAWWLLGAALGLTWIVFAPRWNDLPTSSLIFLASCLFLLAVGPWLVRSQIVNAPEPLLADTRGTLRECLERAYGRRRSYRAWSIYGLFVVSISYKTGMALFMPHSEEQASFLPVVLGFLLIQLIVTAALEFFSYRRIRSLRQEMLGKEKAQRSSSEDHHLTRRRVELHGGAIRFCARDHL